MRMRIVPALLAALALSAPLAAHDAKARSEIDLAICLDTSNSMDGLIASAKLRLWGIVNELAKARPSPVLRVALLSYGNTGYDQHKGWVRLDLPFTSDLDRVYESLQGLRTNGGDEYVARVVRDAVVDLDWTPSRDALKLVFVAGNEAANQDPCFRVDAVFKEAIAKGIQVNTLFCGAPGDPVAAGWREAALLADGSFAVIDQARGAVAVSTPLDGRLAELSGRLNHTYLAYGARGVAGKERQHEMDAAANGAAPQAAAERAVSKSGALYDAKEWDLVDACKDDAGALGKLEAEALPEEMRTMSEAERKAYLEAKRVERSNLQEEIAKAAREREAWLQAQAKEAGAKDGFDAAIREAIRAQAARKGIRLGE